MSGSEIMEEIEKQTDGRWRPGPGSIYPLLAWLQDEGYTKIVPGEEGGIKRYMLTEKGQKIFEEQSKFKEELQRKIEFFAPPLLSGFWFISHPEKLDKIREPARRLVRSLLDFQIALEENFSDQVLEEVAELFDGTTEKIEELTKKLKKQNNG